MDKLGAELDVSVAVIRMLGEDAAADAIAGFEKGDSEAGGGQFCSSGKPGDSRADDEHVGTLRRDGSDSRSRHRADLACASRLR